MNTLREGLKDYLSMRRALGFKLRQPGKLLSDFVSFLEKRRASYITVKLALEWSRQPAFAKPATWAQHLSFVRAFAQYRSSFDARTEIPPLDLLPHRASRPVPYLYSDKEIDQLMQAALNMPRTDEFKKRTYYCLLGLLTVSGMRVSEALNLKVNDIDLEAGVLTVHGAKFGKSRLIPLHFSTREILRDYLLRRSKFLNGEQASFFFVNMVSKRIDSATVRRTFYSLSRDVGLRAPNSSKGPRLHDLRHRFAVETLRSWYRNGEDSERLLPILSAFLGHVHVSDTYWYLTSHPELMAMTVGRMERRWEVIQ